MLQPRISAVETPGKGTLNLETLRRIAAAFDIGLIVRFAPVSGMVEWVEQFDPESFTVAQFAEDKGSERKTNAVRTRTQPRNQKEHGEL